MEGFKLLYEVRLYFLAVADSTSRHATKFDFRRKLPAAQHDAPPRNAIPSGEISKVKDALKKLLSKGDRRQTI